MSGGRRRAQSGVTLVELLVALTLLGLAAAGALSLCTAAPRASAALVRLDRVQQAAQDLESALAGYVTADASAATASYAPGGDWRLPGDSCAYALEAGCAHQATARLPEDLRAAGYTLAYTVAADGGGRRVEIVVGWP